MKNLDESSGPYFPFDRRETYPRRIKVDFRRLPRMTLLAYAAHHELNLRPDITHEELAIAAARHFAEWRVNEDSVIRSFCSRIAASTVGAERGRGNDAIMAEHKRKRDHDVGMDDSCRDLDEVSPPPMERSTRKAVFVAPSLSRPEPTTSRRNRYRRDSEAPSVNELHSRKNCCPPPPLTDHAYGDPEDDEEMVEGEKEGKGEESEKERRVGRVRELDPNRRRRTQCEKERTGGDSNDNSLPRCSTRGSAVATVTTDGTKTFTKGEQVAAYVTRSEDDNEDDDEDDNENSSRAWILARVVRDKTQEPVDLRDEDDDSHMFQLPASDIIRLQDMSSKVQKHDKIMAVFPDTTMFYCATVAKDTPRMDGNTKVMLVSFEDDEDDHGKVQIRRVPVDHVILSQGRAPTGTRGSSSGGRRRGRNSQQQGNPRIACSSSRSTGGGGVARSSQGGTVAAASRGSSGGSASGSSVSGRTNVKKQGTKAGKTYADMISHALTELGERGSYTDICTIIKAEFSDILNWKVESDIRKTPVWKSSVRKILFSNNRFTHCASTTDGHVFAMAHTSNTE